MRAGGTASGGYWERGILPAGDTASEKLEPLRSPKPRSLHPSLAPSPARFIPRSPNPPLAIYSCCSATNGVTLDARSAGRSAARAALVASTPRATRIDTASAAATP